MDETNQNKKSDPAIPERRSIRNIPLTRKQEKELEKIEVQMGEPVTVQTQSGSAESQPSSGPGSKRPTTSSRSKISENNGPRKKGRNNIWIWLIGIIAVLLLIYGIAHHFAHTTISITKAEETVVLSGATSFTLTNATTSPADDLPLGTIEYQNSSFNFSTSTVIAATGTQKVQKKATGKIVVYNDSSTSQDLVASTRFQTSGGLIFRLNSEVTIKPNTDVTVNVTADQAGDNYNVDPQTFTLPGLKGTAKFTTIYGKSSTSMSGGLTATVAVTSDSDLAAAKTLLQQSLTAAANAKAASATPNGYAFLTNSMTITFGDIQQAYAASSKTATLTENATANVYYLEQTSLNSAVASQSQLYAAATSSINADIDTSALSVTIPATASPSSIAITGTSTVSGIFDPTDVAAEVSGLSKSDALAVIRSFPGVESVEISLQPWWERNLPGANAIKVNVQ